MDIDEQNEDLKDTNNLEEKIRIKERLLEVARARSKSPIKAGNEEMEGLRYVG